MTDKISALSSIHVPPSTRQPAQSPPAVASFPSEHLVIGCGVAIFHVASARVVLCRHSRDRYWFLPKGRRDAGEETTRAAEREGFEESGYRNRLLPLPIHHRQPQPHNAPATATNPPPLSSLCVTEPLYTQLVPATRRTQYLLFWYAAETLPPAIEAGMPAPAPSAPYVVPPKAPPSSSSSSQSEDQPCTDHHRLIDRVRDEPAGHEPRRWEDTGVDAEELLYESFLVPVQEAGKRLGGGVMAEVVRRGWEGVVARLDGEGREEWVDDLQVDG